MDSHSDPQVSKKALLAIGATILILAIAIIFYQVGYKSGLASAPAASQQDTTPLADDKAETLDKIEDAKEPVTLNGVGQQASDKIELMTGLATVKISHAGDSHFSIWVLDSEGERVELLVNETGNFDGSKAFRVPADDGYILDISADGAWSVTIQQ